MIWSHRVAAVLAFVAVPALSWLDGSGQLAWTMFSRDGQYRLDAVALDAAGASRPIAPTTLAASAGGRSGQLLAGAERWRTNEIGRVTLGRHVDELAALACDVSRARGVVITFHERAHPAAAERITSRQRACDR